jgi:hypothetical protein
MVGGYIRNVDVLDDFVIVSTVVQGALRSNDNGRTWESINNGLPSPSLYGMKVIGKAIFTSTKNPARVFVSTDYGDNWNEISDGLPTGFEVTAFSVLNGELFVSLFGDGLWHRPLSEVVGIEGQGNQAALGFSLAQNYPNPFTGHSSVRFTMQARENVKLEVFDMFGRRVKTLVDELKEPGEHQVSFDGSGLPAGMYVYSLQAGAVHLERQMCLMK